VRTAGELPRSSRHRLAPPARPGRVHDPANGRRATPGTRHC